jgi:hypothetical protein
MPTAAATLSHHVQAEIIAYRAADAIGDTRGTALAHERIATLTDRVYLHPVEDADGAMLNVAVLAAMADNHLPHDIADEALRLIENLTRYLERANGAKRGAFAGYYFANVA